MTSRPIARQFAAPDFTQPQTPRSVNGFPLTFRCIEVPESPPLWVPRGISRNDQGRCWRIYVVSEEGITAFNVPDTDGKGGAIGSLHRAYDALLGVLMKSKSRFSVDRRARVQGFERDPMVDSGFTGVSIARVNREGHKSVVVSANLTLLSSGGKLRHTHYYAGAVSEAGEPLSPAAQQKKFEQALCRAVAVRRYYRDIRSEGDHPRTMIHYDEVPTPFRRRPVNLQVMDVTEIFDSFVVTPRQRKLRTTGGDPEAMAIELQGHDLAKPHKTCRLNGHRLAFSLVHVEGPALYLPKQLFRARGEWRVRVYHAAGIIDNAISDAEVDEGMLAGSLQKAWLYLVSELRRCPAEIEGRRLLPKIPLLDTGIAGASITAYSRRSRKSGKPVWSFQLGFRQYDCPAGHPRFAVATWRLSTITNEKIAEDLRRVSAISGYWDYLRSAGEETSLIEKDTVVPERFWPDKAPLDLTVDDLDYYADHR